MSAHDSELKTGAYTALVLVTLPRVCEGESNLRPERSFIKVMETDFGEV
jgi:hypothetical protein